jgi:hypothetical protein
MMRTRATSVIVAAVILVALGIYLWHTFGLQWWWRQWSARHSAVGDVDTATVDSLKALDAERPIREADIDRRLSTSAMRSPSSQVHCQVVYLDLSQDEVTCRY